MIGDSSPTGEQRSYFAYGTLLGTAAMREYCPGALPVAVARLPGHRLEFRQYSDDPARCGCHVGDAPGNDLYGVVYSLPVEEMNRLDEASGVSKGWFERIPISVMTPADETIATTTYRLVAPGPAQTPASDYIGLVRTGAQSAGLPDSYVAELLAFLDGLRT